jgi:cytochrome c556
MIGRLVIAAALVSVGVTAAVAQSAAIKARQDVLKTFGPASRAPGLMLRGEMPFEMAAVQSALKVFAEGAAKLPAMFPNDSQTGDTKALPLIWQEKEKFNAIFAKLEADSKAAMTSITNDATFKTEMAKVLGNCGTCHTAYRGR